MAGAVEKGVGGSEALRRITASDVLWGSRHHTWPAFATSRGLSPKVTEHGFPEN